jgi:hypothetical protein
MSLRTSGVPTGTGPYDPDPCHIGVEVMRSHRAATGFSGGANLGCNSDLSPARLTFTTAVASRWLRDGIPDCLEPA